MDDDTPAGSHRARKRAVAEGVRRLLATPGWNPHARPPADAPDAAARTALQAARIDAAEADAATCPDCAAARAASGDPTDLCPRHLARALGLPEP